MNNFPKPHHTKSLSIYPSNPISSNKLFPSIIQQHIPTLKQLNFLHLQIIRLSNLYKKQQRNYQTIRYHLKEVIHQNQMKKLKRCEMAHENYLEQVYFNINKNQLKQFDFQQKIKNQQLDGQFKQIYDDGYMNKMLEKLIKSDVLLKKIGDISAMDSQKDNISNFYLCEKNNYGNINNKTNKLSYSDTKQIHFQQIQLNLAKQKHKNKNLQEEIQILMKQHDNLKKYLECNKDHMKDKKKQDEMNNRDVNAGKLRGKYVNYYYQEEQDINNQREQQEQIYHQISQHNIIQQHSQQQKQQNSQQKQQQQYQQQLSTQQDLEHQIQLLKNLISSKQSISQSLQHTYTQLSLHLKQLQAKQLYYQKKKTFLQSSKLRSFQGKYEKLLTILKQLKQDQMNKKYHEKGMNGVRQKEEKKEYQQKRNLMINCIKGLNQIEIIVEEQVKEKVKLQKLERLMLKSDL